MHQKITRFRYLLCSGLLLLGFSNVSVAQHLQWARGFGGNSSIGATSVATDAAGNVYTAGFFWETVDFDPGTGLAARTTVGLSDVFISRLNASGEHQWVRQLGGTNFGFLSEAYIDADEEGNVYLTMPYSGSIVFDSTSGPSITSTGSNDALVVKIDSTGTLAWMLSIGGSGYDGSFDLKLDTSGNAFVLGSFSGTVDFNPGTGAADTFFLTATATESNFLLKLDPQGNFVWAKQLPKSGSLYSSLAIDDFGNCFIAGQLTASSDFDPGPLTHVLTKAGTADLFVHKLDASGNFIWAKQIAGVNASLRPYDIAADRSGSICVVGNFLDVADFDPGTGATALFELNAGDGSGFIVKLDSAGAFIWAGQVGGNASPVNTFPPTMAASNVRTDNHNNIYVAGGQFRGSMDLDPGPDTLQLTSVNRDLFVLKLDSTGQLFWHGQMPSGDNVNGKAMEVDADKNIYIAGIFSTSADFEPGPADSFLFTVGTSPNGADAFVTKLGCQSYSVLDTAVCGIYILNEQLYDSSGTYTQTLINAAGCDSLLTINLIVTAMDTTVDQQGETLRARMDSAGYQWIDCSNRAAVPGATSQSFTPEADGDYAVVVTNGDCSDTSSCYTVEVTGINNTEAFPEILVFPNPTAGRLTLRTTVALKDVTVRIVNVLGQVMFEQKGLQGSHHRFDVQAFAAGIYYLQLNGVQGSKSFKFIKK